MRTKPSFVTALLGLAAGGAVGWGTVERNSVPLPLSGKAMWAESYRTYAKMAKAADAVVLATCSGWQFGRAVDDEGEALRFGEALFTVDVPLRGPLGVGDAFGVEFTWGIGDTPIILDHDGGPYEAGRRYLLLLRRQTASGLYIVPNPQGRFEVAPDGRLRAPDASVPVAAELAGLTIAQALGYHVAIVGSE